MKNKGIKIVGLMMLSVFLMAGCGNQAKNGAKVSSKESSEKTESVSKTIKVKDYQGEKEVPTNPKKVVVFDMGSLDTLNSLGKSEVVTGVPTKHLPAYLKSFDKVESVGGIKEPDLEKINQLQPDLIIISGRQEDYLKELEAIAPTLYLAVDSTRTWESTKENITTLGKVFNEEKQASEKIKKIETHISDVKEKASASKLTTLVTLLNEGQLSAYGEGSRFGIIHDTFGFLPADKGIETSTHGQSVSFEYVLEKDPEVLFVIDRTKAIGGDTTNNNISENELIAKTRAGQTNKVVFLTPDVWYLSGGGIECTELMLADVEKALE